MIDTAHEDIKCEPKPVAWMYTGKDWRGSNICYLHETKQDDRIWAQRVSETPLYDHKPVPFQDTALYAQRMETEKYKAMLFTSWQTIREQAKGLNRLSNKVKNLNKKYRAPSETVASSSVLDEFSPTYGEAVTYAERHQVSIEDARVHLTSQNKARNLSMEELYPTYESVVDYSDRRGISIDKARVHLTRINMLAVLSKDNVSPEQLKIILIAAILELLNESK